MASAIVRGVGPGIPIMSQLSKGLKETTSATIDQTKVAGFLAARQKDVVDAQKNYNDMVGFGTDAQVKAAKADLDRAKKNLELTQAFAKTANAQDTLTVAQEKYNATAGKTNNTQALQVHAFEGSTKSINLATKAYLDVHNAIVANNPDIQKNIEQTRLQTQETNAVAAAQKNLSTLVLVMPVYVITITR